MRIPAFFAFVLFGPALCAQLTEHPQTIEPGKILVRMDGLTLGLDRSPAPAAENKYTAVGVASTVVSAGLTSSVDVQVGFQLFLRETYEFKGARTSHSGLGDLSFRTKWTFWRDDRIGAAAAVIPYVKVPTNTGGVGNKSVEGGFILPWEMAVGAGFRAGAMFQWDVVRNDADNGYDSRWLTTGFVQRNLTNALAFYGEGTLRVASTGLSDWAATIGAGVLWNVTKRLQLDYELTRGLNGDATDWLHVWRVNWEW
ncbi:MAG TPA: transporter [Opitutaceae bacterium]|nr:transporter [Opitutaceae bacterium]